MITLQEMYERRDELKAKQNDSTASFYSEDQNALTDVHSLIALREKYLLRYINHPPFARVVIAEKLKQFIMEENSPQTREHIRQVVWGVVHAWVATREVACKTDGEDLANLFLTNMVVG